MGRVLLPVQTTAWPFSVFIQLLYKSQQETICSGGWQLGQGGSLGTGHHPHSPWPQHTAIYCSGVDSNN